MAFILIYNELSMNPKTDAKPIQNQYKTDLRTI